MNTPVYQKVAKVCIKDKKLTGSKREKWYFVAARKCSSKSGHVLDVHNVDLVEIWAQVYEEK